MKLAKNGIKGFGLIEVLVTLGVLGIGVLGVITLQGVITRQSLDNKARAEAISIAQSRIEDMRNYTLDIDSLADFQSTYAVTTGFGNAATVTGVNAAFTRTEQIVADGDGRAVTVQVAWTNAEGDLQNVSLDTDFRFVDPRSAGDTAIVPTTPSITTPTGRARIGEGTLPGDATQIGNANDDGTREFEFGDDRLLVDENDQVVLTLVEACQSTQGTCLDFVKVNGTVYIDNTSQNNLDPGEASVLASDAAFCSRYYHDNAGNLVRVTPTTTSALNTATNDYTYFHYTCYIGGGWYGNVGVLLAGGNSQSDKFCVGDPTSDNAWEDPVIATRRVYRGMLYKPDGSTASGKQEVSDGEGGFIVRYYSHGVADEETFLDHDFVLGSLPPSSTDSSYCESAGLMTRADAFASGEAGGLFKDNPADFICLNNGYLDDYDNSAFAHETDCPYNPSDPPSTSHSVEGTIYVTATASDDNLDLVAAMTVRTSDGPGNCQLTDDRSAIESSYSGGQYQANYECAVFDWGSGWTGFVRARYNATALNCSPDAISHRALGIDSTGNDFTCTTGATVLYSGTVSTSGSRRLSAARLTRNDGVIESCSVAADGLSYSCQATNFGDAYTGTLSFTPSGGVACNSPVVLTSLGGGDYTFNLSITANAGQCPAP